MQEILTNSPSDRGTRYAFLAVVLLYLVLGSLFAVGTPKWQVPDEPAHYNYVRHIAEQGSLPVLQEGDFPRDYVGVAKTYNFQGIDISRIRYESHQPPLYYVLSAGVYQLASAVGLDTVFAIRFFSLLLGLGALIAGYRVVRAVFPGDPLVALGAAAFAAVLPMHLTMHGAVNNDVLVELLLALIVGVLVWRNAGQWTIRKAALLGLLLGLAFLTKTQALVAFGIALFALAWDWIAARRAGQSFSLGRAIGLAAVMLGVALLVSSPWLLRNAQVYGWNDLLAMNRHDQVAGAAQTTTQQFLARNGARELALSLVQTTFQSFWGQFGWMGVVLHPRFYYAAFILSAAVGAGFVGYLLRARREQAPLPSTSRRGMAILAAWGLFTLAGFLWYNTQYVQHQGRYLFPAILPIGVAFALGLREILRGPQKWPLAVVGLGVAAMLIDAVRVGNIKWFTTSAMLGAGVGMVGGKQLERRVPGIAMAVVYLAIAAFGVWCLYAYVIPQLGV